MESYKAGIPTGTEVREVRAGRTARAHQPPRIFPGLLALSGLRFHSRPFAGIASRGRRRRSEDRSLRQLRARNGDQARALGNVPGLHGYPDCKTTRRLKAGTRRALQPDELLDEKCPECGSQLVKKHGQYGEFIGCTGYPKCKFIRAKTLGIKCPKCETGELMERGGQEGTRRVFYGCNKYPECDFTTPHLPIPSLARNAARHSSSRSAARLGAVRACIKEGAIGKAAAAGRRAADIRAPGSR